MEQGLYEQLITNTIKSKIDSLETTKYFIDTTTVDKSEASVILSNHLSSVVKIALDSLKGENKLTKKIKITNQIIEFLDEEIDNDFIKEDLVDTNAQILNAIYLKTNNDYSDFSKRLKEITPYTRLSHSELFIGNNAGISMDREIKKEILSANKVCFLVSFIKWSGIRIFERELRDFTANGGELNVITTTYTGATDQKAIDFLSGLPNTEIKVSYNKTNERLHAKAYLFYRNTGFHTGYIGSSNLSRSALTNGLEWNVKITSQEVSHLIKKFQKTFDTYWEDPEFESYDKELHSDKLKASLREESKTFSSDGFSSYFDINPYPFQKTILEKLQIERSVHNHSRNLVVAATGTGKTMISAFDYKAFQSANPNARLLFVAHRLEILKQSIATFRAVLKDNNFGDLWVRNYKPDAYNHLFVSVQTLLNNIDTLDVDSSYYDFIIVDEVHHISASSYRPILEKFTPNILLGLTATPERHDGGDILEDFDNRIAAEIRLPEALNRKLLTPFQYFGISDNIDLSKANWTNGHYDSKELTSLFTKSKTRVRDIVDNLEKYLTDKEEVRALGFCVTQEHAKHMSDSFNSIGLKSDYLTSKNGNRRDELRSKFKSKEINYLFVVDIFNEGVDIPEIDTVLFLRPTESLTIFLQQLGRGLRLSDEKDVLTVLDFVSNSRPEYDFENKFRAIIGKTNNPVKKEVDHLSSFGTIRAGVGKGT
nr:DEAD/DEAH box helicase family protein [Bacteroidales bacterium]